MQCVRVIRTRFLISILLAAFSLPAQRASTQETGASKSAKQEREPMDLIQQQLRELQRSMEAIRTEADRDRAQSRTEISELKQQLRDARQKLESMELLLKTTTEGLQADIDKKPLQVPRTDSQPTNDEQQEQQARKLQEDQQLLAAKVDEQYQTKVESGSKYRLRLSGMLLANFFSNKGNVEHIETPAVALPRGPADPAGSFGGSIRQSQVGFEAYGPTVGGARTQGNLVLDLFGEFSDTVNGFSTGTLRLRTGTVRLDWARTSVIIGQDELFFSPVYPTSFASVSTPPLAYSGNLYGWIPQARIENRVASSENSSVVLSAGVLDPLSGEVPDNEFLRTAGAGESVRLPAYGSGLAWNWKLFGQPFTLGAGGYYSRQNWGFNRNVNGWAGTVDWNIPMGEFLSLSGKFYNGQAIGGLGAGIGRSVLFSGPANSPVVRVKGLHSTGGWAQVKFRPIPKLEFNTAAGQDSVDSADVRGFPVGPPSYFGPNLTRNRSGFANFIYRPRSNLLFSTEFRTLRTFSIDGTSQTANQLNFITAVFF